MPRGRKPLTDEQRAIRKVEINEQNKERNLMRYKNDAEYKEKVLQKMRDKYEVTKVDSNYKKFLKLKQIYEPEK
jgi:hypothetical protein